MQDKLARSLVKKRRRIQLSIALILGLAGLSYCLTPSDEPKHEGKRLSSWLRDICFTPRDQTNTAAVTAVRAIGTNAVPYLIEWVLEGRSNGRKLYRVVNKLLRDTLGFRDKHVEDPAQLRFMIARLGFETLGSTASNAIPSLAALLDRPEDGEGVAFMLTCIGPASLPAFMQALTNGSPTARCNAVSWVGGLGTNARPALPILLDCMKNETNRLTRLRAMLTLGQMRIEPGTVVPAFTNALEDSDPSVRVLAADGLRQFGPAARMATDALTRALADPDPQVRQEAANALREVDSNSTLQRDE